MLLPEVLLQQGRQLEGLVLQQEAGLGREEAEPSYQLPLHQGQAGKLGVVEETLPAEDGVIDAATWKSTRSAWRPTLASFPCKQRSGLMLQRTLCRPPSPRSLPPDLVPTPGPPNPHSAWD